MLYGYSRRMKNPIPCWLVIAICLASGCTGESAGERSISVDPTADSLNTSAVQTIVRYESGEGNADDLRRAYRDLRRAVAIDSLQSTYWLNAARVLTLLDETTRALKLLEGAAAVLPAEGMQYAGFVADAAGKSELARQWYLRSIGAIDERLQVTYSAADIGNRAMAVWLVHGRQAGLEALETLREGDDDGAVFACIVHFADRAELVRLFAGNRGGESEPHPELDSCMAAAMP